MKINTKIRFIPILFWLVLTVNTYSQKKILDHGVYDAWKQIENLKVSDNGKFICYEINPQEGDGLLVFDKTKSGEKIKINRGYNAFITPDENYAVCLIKPFFETTRKAKIKKEKAEKMPKDSLAIISLKTGKIIKHSNVLSYNIGYESSNACAFICTDSALISKAEKKKKEIGKPLIVFQFESSKYDTLHYVDQYTFDKSGKSLVVTINDTTKQKSSFLCKLPHLTPIKLTDKKGFVSLPNFDETGDKVLFLSSADTISSGSKHCDLYLFDYKTQQNELLIDKNYNKNLPENWSISENSNPSFSKNGKQIFVGIAPIILPKDTTLVPFETATLDVWNYDSPQLPPVQLKNLKRDLKQTCLSIYNESKKELTPLTVSFFDNIRTIDEGNSTNVLSLDETKRMISTQWEEQNIKEISLVSTSDGKRNTIATGRFSDVGSSPNGNYIVWYNLEDAQWYLYDIKINITKCITKELKEKFGDEENDVPQYATPYGIAGWSKNDQQVFIYDKFDLWSYSPSTEKLVNATSGEGRKTNRIYRYINLDDKYARRKIGEIIRDKEYIDLQKPLTLSVFDKTSKKQGFAILDLKKTNSTLPAICVIDTFSFTQLKKAKNTDIFTFQKSNFRTSPDVYLSYNLSKPDKKLSDINPQMKDYSWGTAELTKWNAYDGTSLEGLLYKPENFDPTKKYPVILYFYERNSDNLYKYYAPSPSRSIINISFYCSRGYIVFVPDIVYKTGFPGESAYNCIVSGAENLAKNEWVDKNNMAIQGQSWGGYQVAYLVTRTNMFKAAEAGAPVANMTSAYGGIRWGTGVSRQFQYEHTQSRIGKTLWESPELYIKNSPLFSADKVETPLLIMHNDADGAVPWYQGIEYFMALRRLNKKVWMLQYNNEDHNLTERRNMKDLTIRLQQYFDYYLKEEPMPAWMKSGIPATKKGQYFGLEFD